MEGCVTVVPLFAKTAGLTQISEVPGEDLSNDFQVRFLPDLFGASLSGSVIGSGMEEGVVPDARIHFTMMGDLPGYFVTRSDAYGRFMVTVPEREGKLEFFVQPEIPGVGSAEVRIDQDFDQRYLFFNVEPLGLSEREAQIITAMARKVQLSSIYRNINSISDERILHDPIPFYGRPVHSMEKNMAGIDLPPNSFFIDFLAMQPSSDTMKEILSPLDQMPDTRNTLLWVPDLKIERVTPSKISFIAPDYPGEYVVLFRGVDPRGDYITAQTIIYVRC